ncbi:uncharacterized protein [Asterias amurensis]|uniref:uncharacterized protein isoform X2 n=1 Tax=Asterias amurensis TaxID=7602 RepID=UPI003AB63236
MVSGDLALAMAVCHYLPQLSLDRAIPHHVLQRRGAISFSSSSSLFKSLPRLERRGGISFDRTDKAAIYVRMLGDVRVKSKQLTLYADGRRGSFPDNDFKIIDAIDISIRRTSLKHSRELSVSKVCRQPATAAKPPHHIPPKSPPHLDSWYCGQTNQLLNRLSCWDFNIFHLEQVTGGHSMRHVGMQLFHKYGLISHFNLDPTNLYKCFVAIETGYHKGNPYHNALHAADVTQAMYCYLQENKLREVLTPMEVMSAILASATHDLDHPGVNQVFLIATSNHLAELYRNSSVLENHHWRAAISVLRESKLFDHLGKQTWDLIVQQISSLILATDIARQQEFLQKLKNHLNAKDFDMNDASHKNFLLQIALKCADICNPCRQWEISRRWSEMVTEEFFNQGDRERGLQLPLTQNCDRFKNKIQQIQSGFMTFVVEPLFAEWCRFMPTRLSAEMLCNVSKNKALWEAFSEQEKAAENDRKLTSQVVGIKIRKVDEQPGESATETLPAEVEKNTQLNNNNNATTTKSATVLTSLPDGVKKDSSLSSAMEICTRTENALRSPAIKNTQGRADEISASITPVPNSLKNVIVSGVGTKEQSEVRSRQGLSSSMQRRQRPFSVGHLEEVTLSRDGKHELGTQARMHSNPSSPVIPRTQSIRQFNLRLHRTPESSPRKPANFEDPWLVRKIDPHRTSPAPSHINPRQEIQVSELSAMSMELGAQRTQPLSPDRGVARTFTKDRSNPKGLELTTGINNNLNVCIQPGSPRLDARAMRGHVLHSVPSPTPGSRAHSRMSTTATGSKYSHSSQQLRSAHDHVSFSADRSHGVSPRVSRREEMLQVETGRGQVGGRSLAEMGSPWIRKRMEERDQRRQMSKSSSIPPSSLSPRTTPRSFTQASANWYSVPPALGPVIQDFASSQLASIAQHKKQSKEIQAKATTVQPTSKTRDTF